MKTTTIIPLDPVAGLVLWPGVSRSGMANAVPRPLDA
jgi:hypothetical protein